MKKQKIWGKSRGNIGDILSMGFCILAMTIVMGAYLDNVEVIWQKSHIGQIARNYILKMETEGGMTPEDEIMLIQELDALGITDIDLSGTTFGETKYGERVSLNIRGKLKGGYEFEESRVSTAKN
ncbi:MAG: hypothetical protein NC251_07130 [Lachnoclostridium sp.]|nr:hypothetical protein [Lachnospira sp.]MCM1248184.1 hypothetical protein [Lachnoclostridium sp.]MCM1534467.1 hypothetical protein [Clostridium sp.]